MNRWLLALAILLEAGWLLSLAAMVLRRGTG
jgi:hypothetical protein